MCVGQLLVGVVARVCVKHGVSPAKRTEIRTVPESLTEPDKMTIKVYMTSVTSSNEIKGKQRKINMILSSKKIDFVEVDISADDAAKEFMRSNSVSKEGAVALPPQIFNEDQYCGDYEAFEEAVELEEMDKFLKLE